MFRMNESFRSYDAIPRRKSSGLYDSDLSRECLVIKDLLSCPGRDLSRPQVDIVSLNLRIQRRGIHAQQARGARLVSACLIQGTADQIDFKAAHFVVKVDAAAYVYAR